MRAGILVLLMCGIATVFADLAAGQNNALFAPAFPRLMGMNINGQYDRTEYQKETSRLHVAILGFYPGWGKETGVADPIGTSVRAIKARSRGMLLGSYTVLNEAIPPGKPDHNQDKAYKVNRENWWLRDEKGQMTKWTDLYNAFEINITEWAKPDFNGKRYPEWLAERDFRHFFGTVPEFDIWYVDNALSKSPVKVADWDLDGRNDRNDDPRIAAAFRRGNVAEWQRIRELKPGVLIVANSDDVSSPEYSGKVNGVFMEALIGQSWSIETWGGWDKVMERYHQTMRHVLPPRLVGFNVWGRRDDYRTMRYGLASSLLNDGYFVYTDNAQEYRGMVWFDEYDVPLGMPLEPPQERPWQNGVYRRRFERGVALVNPTRAAVTVQLEPGYRRFAGKQDPAVNDGRPLQRLLLPPRDGALLIRE